MKQNLLKYGVMIVLATIASTALLWADCYVEVDTNVEAHALSENLSQDSIVDSYAVACIEESTLPNENVTEKQLSMKREDRAKTQDMTLNLCIWGVFVVITLLLVVWLLRTTDFHRKTFSKIWQLYYTNLPRLIYNNLQGERIGHLVTLYFAGGISCLFVTCLCSGTIEPASDLWERLGQRLNTHPLVTSLLGTFWGLYIIYLSFRPWVCIDPKLFAFGKQEKLKVRLRNFGFFPVHNVRVELHWCRHVGKALKTIDIPMYSGDALIMESVITKLGNKSYEFHTKKVCNVWKQYEEDVFAEYIRCRVSATHSVSGITRVYEHKFSRSDFEKAFKKNSVVVNTPKKE